MTLALVIGNKNYSSWSLRAWLLLAESKIPFDEIRLPLDTAEFPQQVRQYSDAACVPVLLIDDQAVWDSLAIAETIAERYPQAALWPESAAARAHARSVSGEMHSGFLGLREQMPMNCRATGRKVAQTEELVRDIDRVLAIWSDCADRYGGGWLFGRFSVADAMYAPVALRLRSYGIDLPDAAKSYSERLLKSDALQNWLAAARSESEVLDREE